MGKDLEVGLLDKRRNSNSTKSSVSLVLLCLVLIAACGIIINRSAHKEEEGRQEEEIVQPAFVSRGPSHGVSEKSTGVSVASPYPWTNAELKWQRTGFHFQPEKNWMNDPNGPLFYKGWYHLFYQYNPDSAIWGNISWGHAVSKELVHWYYLELAMVPDRWYDMNGVWTGSATFLPDGRLVMLYTGSTNESVQVQNLAMPGDPEDPLLRNWVKSTANPVLNPPEGIGLTDFRDPTTGWVDDDGVWRIIIGSKLNKTGIALTFMTRDFVHYEQEGILHSVPGTGMWECVDFYPINISGSPLGVDTSVTGPGVKHVLKASMDDDKHDYYAVGTYDVENQKFVPDDPEEDVGIGLRLDYGKYYAAKTFYDQNKGRRVLWGWVGETDSEQDDLMKGWASIQTIPRKVWFDSKTKANILQWPVEEIDELRSGKLELENVVLPPGSVVKVNTSAAAQMDIELVVEFPSQDVLRQTLEADVLYNCSTSGGARGRGALGPFGLLVLADEILTEQTAVYFYIAKSADGQLKTFFCHDETRSSHATDLILRIHGSSVPVLLDEKTISVRTIVDHSIVESYFQGGRRCITSRVYPTRAIDGAAKLFLFNNATSSFFTVKSLNVWQMKSVLMRPYES
uniref:TSA: Wollemia nobilis Ref_Wollemi_Transcript_21962_2474 transcribed RNA sequence n=1 Tax=Wollemia nobilis TaxID=56998 RepID=A0A0C9S227_9CONI